MTGAFRAGWDAGRQPRRSAMRWWEHLIPNRRVLYGIREQVTAVEETMALNANELKQRIDDATTNLGGDLRRVKDQLAQALADQNVVADGAVQDALAGFDTLAERLENLAAETPEDELDDDVDPEAPVVPEAPVEGEGGPDSEPVDRA